MPARFCRLVGVTVRREGAGLRLPEPKPRATREHFVVPSTCNRKVIRVQRPNIRLCEDVFQLAAQFNALLPSVNPDPRRGPPFTTR